MSANYCYTDEEWSILETHLGVKNPDELHKFLQNSLRMSDLGDLKYKLKDFPHIYNTLTTYQIQESVKIIIDHHEIKPLFEEDESYSINISNEDKLNLKKGDRSFIYKITKYMNNKLLRYIAVSDVVIVRFLNEYYLIKSNDISPAEIVITDEYIRVHIIYNDLYSSHRVISGFDRLQDPDYITKLIIYVDSKECETP